MDPVTTGAWLVLLAVMGATVTFLLRARRRGAPIALVTAGTLAFFSGLITVGMAAGHLFAVTIVELRRSPIRYDFRVYGLLLLGAVLVALGTRLVAASTGVVRGERAAWRRAVGAAVALVAVNVPLAPIQGFAKALGIFAVIGLAALLAAHGRLAKGSV